jgi:hypothetical protein
MNDNRQIFIIIITAIFAVLFSSILTVFSSFKAGIVGLLGIFCLAIFYKYPRVGLWLFLIYIPFGASITYSMGSIYSAIQGYVTYSREYAVFQFIKDIFYFPALLAIIASGGFLAKIRQKISHRLILTLLALFISTLLTLILVNLGQQFTSAGNEKPLIMGAIGLKTLVGYVPLLLCGYVLIRDREDLWLLMRLQVAIALICCSLALIQYWLLVGGVCPGNVNLAEPAYSRASLQARCFIGGSLLYNPKLGTIALPGTFAAPWQWAWFLIASSFFTLGSILGDASRIWKGLAWGALTLLLINAFVSGQTTAAILVPLIAISLLFIGDRTPKFFPWKLGILICLLAIVLGHGEILNSIIARWQYSPPEKFIIKEFTSIFNSNLELLGKGLGRASSAARRFGKITAIETFYPKLLFESGIIGVLTFLSAVTALTTYTFKAYRSLATKSLHQLGFCLWCFVLLISYNTFQTPLTVDPVAIYYWFFAGVILKLPQLDPK